MFEKLMNMNRQTIFVLVALAVIIPMLLHIRLPLTVSEPTQKLYDYIDALPPGSTIMISFDYGPSSFAEPEPMAEAVMKHCFDKGIRVIGVTLDSQAVTLADKVMQKVATEKGAVDGTDYVLLGYRPGAVQVIVGMGAEIANIFESDYTGKPLAEIPMMQDITNYDQIDLLLDLGCWSHGGILDYLRQYEIQPEDRGRRYRRNCFRDVSVSTDRTVGGFDAGVFRGS